MRTPKRGREQGKQKRRPKSSRLLSGRDVDLRVDFDAVQPIDRAVQGLIDCGADLRHSLFQRLSDALDHAPFEAVEDRDQRVSDFSWIDELHFYGLVVCGRLTYGAAPASRPAALAL